MQQSKHFHPYIIPLAAYVFEPYLQFKDIQIARTVVPPPGIFVRDANDVLVNHSDPRQHHGRIYTIVNMPKGPHSNLSDAALHIIGSLLPPDTSDAADDRYRRFIDVPPVGKLTSHEQILREQHVKNILDELGHSNAYQQVKDLRKRLSNLCEEDENATLLACININLMSRAGNSYPPNLQN